MAKYGMNDINAQFQQHLGRNPTGAEADYLQKFLDEGSLQPYEIGQILQGTPEYQQSLLQKNTQQYSQMLGANDQDILNKAAAAGNSQFASLGRPVTSAQAGALAQAGQSLAQQRQGQLASFYGGGLQQNAGLYQGGAQDALSRGYGLRDEARQFGQAQDLARYQSDMYQNYLNQANRLQRSRGLGSAIGGLAGAGLGAYFGGPAGAAAGGQAGGGIGAGFGGLF